jgi:hypothetical protein
MCKILFQLFVLFFIIVSTTGCAHDPIAPRSAAELALVDRPPLPVPLVVISSQRFGHRTPTSRPPDDFGRAIALGDGVLAIGAPDRTSGDMGQSGSVMVYRRQGEQWIEETQLFAGDQQGGSQHKLYFGSTLAFSSDLLFVGAPGADDSQVGDDSGAVYIFQDAPGGWQEVARLAAKQPVASAGLGSLLAAFGDTLAAGDGYEGQRVTIFQRSSGQWSQQTSLEIPQVEGAITSLGSLALYGDTLVLNTGSRKGEGETAQISSRLLIYERSGNEWRGPAELDGQGATYAGSVALDGDGERATRLAVGGVLDRDEIGSSGVAIFERHTPDWELSAILTCPEEDSTNGFSISSFGASLALQGDLLLVGTPLSSEDSYLDGVAYLFEYHQGRWVEQLRLTQTHDDGQGDFFGGSTALYGNTVLIGAADEFGQAAYVFEVGNRKK